MNRHAIPGDSDDLYSVFMACLRVGKFDRALLLLKRANTSALSTPDERVHLHNQYIRAVLDQARITSDVKQVETLHQWYEMYINRQRLPRTAETIACMLKASILSERGFRLHRLVKRYMSMAPGEAGLEVLSMAEILSDADLAVITDICPVYNFTPEPEPADDVQADPEATAMNGPSPTPELLQTPQQGEGLATLIKGLSYIRTLDTVDISKLPIEKQKEVQLQIERDTIANAIEKWRADAEKMKKMGINPLLGSGSSTEQGSLSQNLASWMEAIELRIKQEMTLIDISEKKDVKSDEDHERCLYGPFIRDADPSRLAAVTILTVINMSAMLGADKGVVSSRLVMGVSNYVQEDLLQQRRAKAKAQKARLRRVKFNADAEERKSIQRTPASSSEEEKTPPPVIQPGLSEDDILERSEKPWSLSIKAQVGSFLVRSLVENSKINVVKRLSKHSKPISQLQPAFTHMYQPRRGKKVGVVFLNPHLIEQLKKEPISDHVAKHLPMVVEPRPWKGVTDGGFLEGKNNLVRVKSGDKEQKMYAAAAVKDGSLDTFLKGLDALGKTAWQIDRKLFDVMLQAWNTGEKIANIPALNPKLESPPEPEPSDDPSVRKMWLRDVKLVENERQSLHSQRCFINLQLEVARTFRNQTIYFPHNVDYRGRAYPIPTYLNHMGADHTRALMRFAKGKELGIRGLRWLKIHLANVYGLDKASFDEREAFAMDNIANINNSAKNPLDGKKWWLEAEDPWQCLAACFELSAALELPDPTKFVSHIPIQQDGTCNGLQHYAALGGDKVGARQVNLEPGDRPADVYSAVAEGVKERIAADVQEKHPFGAIMTGKITRKVVKQTVMTNVYGVTFSGAKKQVCKQLDALYPTLGEDNGTTNITLASYVARHIFTSLASMFRGAHDIQYWLGEIGGRVCRALTHAQIEQIASEFAEQERGKKTKTKAADTGKTSKGKKSAALKLDDLIRQFRSTVVWTTPLRLPVVQPYRKSTKKEVRTCLQAITYPISDQTDPVNRRKQLQGFPPNFIHSLDASHMLLSALQCHDVGLDFAAVHDSFWTHACDVDQMNSILREAFIQIHEEDVVGRLASEFRARHKGSLYLAHIDPLSPVAQKIKELRSNSKLTPSEELLLEHKRNTLRLSGNPWDLEAAKQIVTPASVYEDMDAAEEDVTIKEDSKNLGIGEMPTELEEAEELQAMKEKMEQMSEDGYVDDPVDIPAEETAPEVTRTSAAKSVKNPIAIWLPLTIPDIPKKVSSYSIGPSARELVTDLNLG